jgi:pyruvate/2-oxoglutarate dehydrogenase complex dihydrolipoamide acyltransferase (E2) component
VPLFLRNWADLVKRARAKQLSPDEFTTGNFTISNLGMFGVDTFDAILPPGAAGHTHTTPNPPPPSLPRLISSAAPTSSCAVIELHT